MSEPFVGEVRMMSFNFAPKGWATCDGQLLPINQNQALFSLLGTNFGGDGRLNFGLPDLRGRAPIHTGGQGGHTLGQRGGEQSHTLAISELPQHIHLANATSVTSNASNPSNNVLAAGNNRYTAATNLTSLLASTVKSTGGSQAHENMQPFLTINFSIALQGIFPSQN